MTVRPPNPLIRPAGVRHSDHVGVSDTNVLVTRSQPETAIVEVDDAIAMDDAQRPVRCVRGGADIVVEVCPRPQFAADEVRRGATDGHAAERGEFPT